MEGMTNLFGVAAVIASLIFVVSFKYEYEETNHYLAF